MEIKRIELNFSEKEKVLKKAIDLNTELLKQIESTGFSFDDLDVYFQAKEEILVKMNELDSQTDELLKLCDSSMIKPDSNEMGSLKKLVNYLDELTDSLRTLEEQVKVGVEKYLKSRRDEIKEGRVNSKAAMNYYKVQSNMDFVDPQYLDSKK